MNENELLKLTYPVGKFEWNEKPNKEEINPYIEALNKEILNDKDTELWLIGRMVNFIDEKLITPKTKVFKAISDLIINL